MNKFTFKGISSDYFDIIVQELPPIVRPQQRTSVIYVDGRDGAIVESLGYESYEKSFFIGLKKPDRIDEINSWLIGAGDLIISSEPDKFYKAICTASISYERVVRSRQATIKFLVEPYKYLLGEEIKTTGPFVNQGTIPSKPKIEIEHAGNITLLVNNQHFCKIDAGDGKTILDSELEEAYKGNGNSANRLIEGEFPTFLPGENVITFTGSATVKSVEIRSRFI